MSLLTSPLAIAAILGWLATGATYLVQEFQQGRQWKVAYEQGLSAGKGSASTATVESATETANARREAFERTPMPADRKAIIDLCKMRASCRERAELRK